MLGAMSEKRKIQHVVVDVLLIAGLVATGAYAFRQILSSLIVDPDKEKHEQARLRAEAHLRSLQNRRTRNEQHASSSTSTRSSDDGVHDDNTRASRPDFHVEDLALNQYESVIALDLVSPDDIPVGFGSIGGLGSIIEELKDSVIYPLTMPELYSHAGSLLSAPSGVLLYGPPGCGKTMLAKAVAKESGASFINLHISTLTEKWYGDSNKLVRAVFSLARKMQPCIIFIDEIDAVLRARATSDHEASGMVKAEFMTLWDGLVSADASGDAARIVVLGATNRIHDIDEAILRRMPKKFPVPLPDTEQRRRILQLILRDTKLDEEHFDLDYLAKITKGMSGSDIKEACRDAAMAPVREYIRQQAATPQPAAAAAQSSGSNSSKPLDGRAVDARQIRGVRTEDFLGKRGGTPLIEKNHATEISQAQRKDKEAQEAAAMIQALDELEPEPLS